MHKLVATRTNLKTLVPAINSKTRDRHLQLRHIDIMVFREGLVGPVASGIRRINLIPRFYELPDFRLKEIMIFSISVYQNNRSPLPDLSVMEGNAVYIYRILCFI